MEIRNRSIVCEVMRGASPRERYQIVGRPRASRATSSACPVPRCSLEKRNPMPDADRRAKPGRIADDGETAGGGTTMVAQRYVGKQWLAPDSWQHFGCLGFEPRPLPAPGWAIRVPTRGAGYCLAFCSNIRESSGGRQGFRSPRVQCMGGRFQCRSSAISSVNFKLSPTCVIVIDLAESRECRPTLTLRGGARVPPWAWATSPSVGGDRSAQVGGGPCLFRRDNRPARN